MRLYQVVLRSGANMDFMAKVMIDDPASEAVLFYQDESRQNLVATVWRDQVAGIIFHSQRSGVSVATTPLTRM
jgi:hypothetical protein